MGEDLRRKARCGLDVYTPSILHVYGFIMSGRCSAVYTSRVSADYE